jgi:hypothetical protein
MCKDTNNSFKCFYIQISDTICVDNTSNNQNCKDYSIYNSFSKENINYACINLSNTEYCNLNNLAYPISDKMCKDVIPPYSCIYIQATDPICIKNDSTNN